MANHDTIPIALQLYLFQPSIDIFHASEFISMSSRCFRWYIHCFIKPWPILCQWPLNYFQVVSFFGIINTALVNIYTYIFECLGEIFHGSGIVRSKDNLKCCTSYSFSTVHTATKTEDQQSFEFIANGRRNTTPCFSLYWG